MDKKYKILIPNILTLTRIIFTPIIIILSILGHLKIAIIFVIMAAITDLFDGYLARKWNTVSLTGAKLDAVADKIFVIGIVCSLITKYKFYIYILILEIIIALTNMYYHYKNNKTESLYIGKFKTTILFINIILSILNILVANVDNITNATFYVTINLQILCIISYMYNYFEKKKNKPTIEDNEMHNEIMNDKTLKYELDKTMVINNLKDIEEKIYDIEKDDLY